MSDFAEFHRLALDLGAVADGVAESLLPAARGTAGLIKETWNGKLYREGHARLTGGAISFDVGVAHDFDLFATTADGVKSSSIVAEIGARRGSHRQAGLVRLLENGSAHNAPHGYGAAALEEHAGDFEAAIAFAEAAAAGRFGL